MNPPPGSSRVFEIGSEFFQMPAGFLSDKFRAGFGLIARAAGPVHAGGFFNDGRRLLGSARCEQLGGSHRPSKEELNGKAERAARCVLI
jgi:hypothetical protein